MSENEVTLEELRDRLTIAERRKLRAGDELSRARKNYEDSRDAFLAAQSHLIERMRHEVSKSCPKTK